MNAALDPVSVEETLGGGRGPPGPGFGLAGQMPTEVYKISFVLCRPKRRTKTRGTNFRDPHFSSAEGELSDKLESSILE